MQPKIRAAVDALPPPVTPLTAPALPFAAGGYGVGGRRGGQERANRSLERRPPVRTKRGGILIACNQRATPYLTGLVQATQLEEVVTLSPCAAEDPAAIVAHGVKACATHGPFHRFYAVACCSTQEELRHQFAHPPDIQEIGYALQFKMLFSVPSFNLWLLMHWMELPLGPWRDYEQLSAWINEQLAQQLSPALLNQADQLFSFIGSGVADALARGQQLSRQVQGTLSTVYPMTDLHELVLYLLKLHGTSQRLRG